MPGIIELLRALTLELREKRCHVCSVPMPPAAALPEYIGCAICPDCLARIPRRIKGFCPVCGEFYASRDITGLCPHCLQKPKLWGKIIFHSAYAGDMRELILGLKFGGRLHLAEALGSLLAAHPSLQDGGYDCLVPVPLHRKRLARRGFNQAQEIARSLSGHLHLPLRPGLLERIVDTRHQTGLNRRQRVQNTRGAFSAAPLQGERILLLDDIMTTGATLQAASACLLKAGAGQVDVAVLARTPARNMCKEL